MTPATTARFIAAAANCCSRTRTRLYPGALIASLSIPWGEAKSDDDLGGYHLVWTRDMVNSVTGLAGGRRSCDTALRALIYLACAQRPDGGFPQNFWIDGRAVLEAASNSTKSRFRSCSHGGCTSGRLEGLRSVSDGAARAACS